MSDQVDGRVVGFDGLGGREGRHRVQQNEEEGRARLHRVGHPSRSLL